MIQSTWRTLQPRSTWSKNLTDVLCVFTRPHNKISSEAAVNIWNDQSSTLHSNTSHLIPVVSKLWQNTSSGHALALPSIVATAFYFLSGLQLEQITKLPSNQFSSPKSPALRTCLDLTLHPKEVALLKHTPEGHKGRPIGSSSPN